MTTDAGSEVFFGQNYEVVQMDNILYAVQVFGSMDHLILLVLV